MVRLFVVYSFPLMLSTKMGLNSIFPASYPTALDVGSYVTLNSLMRINSTDKSISLAHPTTALNKRHASYRNSEPTDEL